MAKLIIEPRKTKDGQIEYTVNYHDPKSDNSFTVTTTNDLNEAVERVEVDAGKRSAGDPAEEIILPLKNLKRRYMDPRDLNPRPLRCERNDLPLIYEPAAGVDYRF